MNEVKHTRGEWRRSNTRAGLVIVAEDGTTIGAAHIRPVGAKDGEAEANAAIFVAGPTMLAALCEVVEVAERYMEFDPESRFGVAIEAARAAIAHAKGLTP